MKLFYLLLIVIAIYPSLSLANSCKNLFVESNVEKPSIPKIGYTISSELQKMSGIKVPTPKEKIEKLAHELGEEVTFVKEIVVGLGLSLKNLPEIKILKDITDPRFKDQDLKFIWAEGHLAFITKDSGGFLKNTNKRWGIFDFKQIGFHSLKDMSIEMNNKETLNIYSSRGQVFIYSKEIKDYKQVEAVLEQEGLPEYFKSFFSEYSVEVQSLMDKTPLTVSDFFKTGVLVPGKHIESGDVVYMVHTGELSYLFSTGRIQQSERVTEFSYSQFGVIRGDDAHFQFVNGVDIKLKSGKFNFHASHPKKFLSDVLNNFKMISEKENLKKEEQEKLIDFIDFLETHFKEIVEMLEADVLDMHSLKPGYLLKLESQYTGKGLYVLQTGRDDFHFITDQPQHLGLTKKWGRLEDVNISESGNTFELVSSGLIFKIESSPGYTDSKRVVVKDISQMSTGY